MSAIGIDPLSLPKLRPDLILYKGPPGVGETPTWNIFDPSRDQYFQIGWLEYEYFKRWHLRKTPDIIASIHKETTLKTNPDHILSFAQFLRTNELTIVKTIDDVREILSNKRKQEAQEKDYKTYFYKYFYIKIKLLRPDVFLDATIKYINPLFTKTFLYLLLVFGVFGLYLVSRQWYEFKDTLQYYFNFKSLIYYIPAILFAKILHEFGHAYAAKKYNCKVPTMGVAFLFLWPVFYTDTTDSYKLSSRKERIVISSAGIITELTLAVFATLLWNFLPDGPIRSASFFIASVSWLLSILININPFLKFDGYYLMADILGVDNLQSRSFSLGRWKLAQLLFGFDMPPPLHFSAKKTRVLIIYAFCTWIFRIFLYMGIAYMIYSRFFKVLGIILMCTAMLKFLIIPVSKEVKNYFSKRDEIKLNKNTILSSILIVSFISIFFIPWQSYIVIPGVVDYKKNYKLYSPDSVQLKSYQLKIGQEIIKDEILVSYDKPDLIQNIKKTRLEIEKLEHQARTEIGQTEKLGFKQTAQEELISKETYLKGLINEYKNLIVKAPFSGKIVSINHNLNEKDWIKKDILLAELVDQSEKIIRAYISEFDLSKVKIGAQARFFPSNQPDKFIKATIIEIDKTSTIALDDLYLASTFKGNIPVSKNNEGHYIPTQAYYKITLRCTDNINLMNIQSGNISIEGKPHSIFGRLFTKINSVIVRESGF